MPNILGFLERGCRFFVTPATFLEELRNEASYATKGKMTNKQSLTLLPSQKTKEETTKKRFRRLAGE